MSWTDKRSIMDTYHKISVKYLPSHVAEFEFRYNNRKNYGYLRCGCSKVLSCKKVRRKRGRSQDGK